MRRAAIVAILAVTALSLEFAFAGYPFGVSGGARAIIPAALSVGFLGPVESLNPFIGINDASYLLYGLLYDYPFSYDQDGNLIPNLITNATCAVPDCSSWNYQVRQGVVWSDGTGLTAADVSFTWNYDSQDLFHLWAYEPYFNQVVQCTGGNKPRCGAQVTGTWQVTVYFQRPFASGETLFAPILEMAQWSNVTPAAAQTTYSNANPIGTGPFVADPNIYNEWQQNGQVPLHVYRNPWYHPVGLHMGPVNISDLYLTIYPDPQSMALALQAGDIQLAQFPLSEIQTLQGKPGIEVQQGLQAIQEWNEIGISQIDTSAADGRLNPARFDYRVREAMARATNKDYIVRNFYAGAGVRGDSLVSPITPQWWYDPVGGGDNLTFDLNAANAILDADGWTGTWSDATGTYRMNPNPITVSYQTACFQCVSPANVTTTIPSGTHLAFTLATRPQSAFPEEVDTANYLAYEFAQIGIKVTVKVETTELGLSSDVYNGYVEMYIWYWSGDPDPNYLLSMESSWTLDGWNDDYWNNGTYNALFLQQLGDTDPVTRQAEVKAAEKLFYETAVYIIYIYPFGNWAMRTDTVPSGQQWTGWGNWSRHPYRQMNAYWTANPLWLNLTCSLCAFDGGPNQPPAVPVIAGPDYIGTWNGATLAFTANTSDRETTDSLNWTWHWGDGLVTHTNGTAANPVSAASHSWTLVGNYTVTVDVTDGFNSPISSLPVYVNVSQAVAGKLEGVVTNPLHHAIVGASVTIYPGPLSTTTDATGNYSVSLMPGTYDVLVQAPLYAPYTVANLSLPNGATRVLDFELGWGGGWIAGRVTSVSGAPISDATVQATSAAGAKTTGSTDGQGQYNLSVAGGSYTVNVTAPGYTGQTQTGKAVGLGTTTVVEFALTPLPGRIYGTILGSGNTPLSNATVIISQASGTGSVTLYTVTTDSVGSYGRSLPPGTYVVSVAVPGYVSQTRTGVVVGPGASVAANFTLVTQSSGPPSGPPSVSEVMLVALGVALGAAAATVVIVILLRRGKVGGGERPPD